MPASLTGTEAARAERALTPGAIAPAKLAIRALRDMSFPFALCCSPVGWPPGRHFKPRALNSHRMRPLAGVHVALLAAALNGR
jgi:hypothetical protein